MWRLPFLVWFGFVFVGHLKDPEHGSILSFLNLGIHELGHTVLMWAPQFVCVAGGTIAQLAAPIFGLWNFYRQDDFFSMALCFGWLSTNLFSVSNYMADATTMQLTLVSPFGSEGIIHDWNYLFTHMGLLAYDQQVAAVVYLIGIVSMLICFISGGLLLWQMAVSRTPKL